MSLYNCLEKIRVIKRDGTEVNFESEKITNAIFSAAKSVSGENYKLAFDLAYKVFLNLLDNENQFEKKNDCLYIPVEDIQDTVEKILIENGHAKTAKAYILYRKKRSDIREMKSVEHKVITDLIYADSEAMDDKRENANIDGNSTMGGMLKVGGTVMKEYALKHVFSAEYADLHKRGIIHMHDLDFSLFTINCLQIPLGKLLKNGFSTGHGSLRSPSTIGSASTLTCVIIQSNQNDMFGGQSIPMLDYDLAPYVSKSYIRNIAKILEIKYDNIYPKWLKNIFIKQLDEYVKNGNLLMNDVGSSKIKKILKIYKHLFIDVTVDEKYHDHYYNVEIDSILALAKTYTEKDTHQAMEALVHNLCNLSSRAGGQVPFSSVNFGTDISEEGRMVSKNLMLSMYEGLGNGETAIFPIAIMKLKKGVTDKGSPNYDLFQLSCKVSAKRLYPNWVNESATFNAQYYKEGHPETEVATMGCRTRVIGNIYDPDNQVTPGRGNLFPTTISLPYIALEAKRNSKCDINSKELIKEFYNVLDKRMSQVFGYLLERFEIVCKRKVKNYPFLMGQELYIGSEKLSSEDSIKEAIKHGTLVTGFIGLAEALIVLTGKHHGESKESQKLGLEIISYMNDKCSEKAKETNLNFSFMGAPAEGCCGRLLKCLRKEFGIIDRVTTNEYLTNSHHVPVDFQISIKDKVDIEAPYHELEPAGHISYIEVDGDPEKNVEAFQEIVEYMANKNMGYFSINHPMSRDPICGYVGLIGDVCPRCGRRDGEEIEISKLKKLAICNPDPKYAKIFDTFEAEEASIPQTF